MQALEIVVYILVAIVIAGSLLYVSLSMSPSQSLLTQEELGFRQVTSDELPLVAASLWADCRFGLEAQNLTLVLTQGLVVNETFFRVINQHNLCSDLQSSAFSCGNREDVLFSKSINDQERPTLLQLECVPQERLLIIR